MCTKVFANVKIELSCYSLPYIYIYHRRDIFRKLNTRRWKSVSSEAPIAGKSDLLYCIQRINYLVHLLSLSKLIFYIRDFIIVDGRTVVGMIICATGKPFAVAVKVTLVLVSILYILWMVIRAKPTYKLREGTFMDI